MLITFVNKTNRSIGEENQHLHRPLSKHLSTISKCSEEGEEDICLDYNEEVSNRLISDEERKYGKIPTRIYLLYLRSCGLVLVSIFCLTAFGWQALKIYTDVWLRDWMEWTKNNESEDDLEV